MVDGKSEGIMGYKNITTYKIIVSILFGLLGFVVNFYSINFPFPPYTATVLIGLLFPMLITLTWGWRYGLLSALAGGCQSMWWIWGPSNGYAILFIVPPFTLWILWHGYFAEMRRKSDDRKWWQNMYVVEIPFRLLSTINLYTLARWGISLNPPPWGWASEASSIVPMEFTNFVVIKQFVVAYVILLLADVLLNIEFTRRFFGLEKRPDHSETGYIISLSLLVGVIFWIIGSVVFSVIFYTERSFLDMLALNIPPVVLFMRIFFILACLAGGLMFSKLLHKHQEIESSYKYLYSMVRLMCDNLPDLIWTKDLKSRYIFTNKSCCEILLNAKDTDEPIGKSDMYFAEREKETHPENPDYHTFGEKCTDSDLMVVETKKPIREDEFGNLKGEKIYLDVYKAPFFDNNNDMIGTVGCARIITKEKELEEAHIKADEVLQESEERFRAIFDSINDAVFIHDIETGAILDVNNRALEMYGYSLKEISQLDVQAISLGEAPYSQQDALGWMKKAAMGEPQVFEWIAKHKSGRTFWVEVSIKSAVVGKHKRLLVVVRDITERKQAEEEIHKLNQELEQRVQERTAELEEKNEELERMNKLFMGRELRMAELKKQIAELENDAKPDENAGDGTA